MLLRWKRPPSLAPVSTRVTFRTITSEALRRRGEGGAHQDGGQKGGGRPQAAGEPIRPGTRDRVAGWVRAELAPAEGRIEHAVAAAEQRLAELVETRAAERFDRVAAAERKMASAAANAERRIEAQVDSAAAEAERRTAEHAARLYEKAEARLLEAEARVRDAERKLSRRTRRQELRLVRQERNRKIAAAERRLAERGHALLAELESQAADAHHRLAALEAETRQRPSVVGRRDLGPPSARRAGDEAKTRS